MISFESDYTMGAHPAVLEALLKTNTEPLPGYGTDRYCASAREKIRAACGAPDADVHFLVGGTQTNALVIAAMLDGTEGVIAARTGHVSLHEAGAIEHTGHKVLEVPEQDGKITPETLDATLSAFFTDENRAHMVHPGMVYISHPTEYGTLYTKDELTMLSRICRAHGIPLYLDGARLGYGLMSDASDLTLSDIAALCDVFYIGGTKVGALCGEAVVFPRSNAPKRFFTRIKQHGALLAKGRLLGVQFDALFTDGLYLKISRHAIEMANMLRDVLKKAGCRFYIDSPTNQQFVVLENARLEALGREVAISFWERLDDAHTVVRLATSWATREEEIRALAQILS